MSLIKNVFKNVSRNAQGDFHEDGQTAIMSVMFFSIVMAILTVSFMSTVTAAQSSAINNELQASAVASADNGVEDAKRVIAYCSNNPGNSNCQVIVNTPYESAGGCTGAVANAIKNILLDQNILGATQMKDGSGDIKVGASGAYSQAYSCLLIGRSAEYSGYLKKDGTSEIIPLNFVDASGNQAVPSYVIIQWSNNLPSSDPNSDKTTRPLAGSDFPNTTKWGMAPATVRVELARFRSGDSIDIMTQSARAVTMRPSQSDNYFGAPSKSMPTLSGGSAVSGMTTAYDFEYWTPLTDPNTQNTPLAQRDCDPAANGYWCSAAFYDSLGFRAYDSPYNSPMGVGDYIRLQGYYNDAHFRVTAYNSSGKQLYFRNVFGVDSTGRASDAFYRVKALISQGNDRGIGVDESGWYPDFAIDAGGVVCKELSVTAKSGTDSCSY